VREREESGSAGRRAKSSFGLRRSCAHGLSIISNGFGRSRCGAACGLARAS
jgi:hypothetical protein